MARENGGEAAPQPVPARTGSGRAWRDALRAEARSAGAVGALHREVDREAGRIAASLGSRLRCGRGCSSCCCDDLTVFAVEAAWIADGYPELLRSGTPHPPGGCAFLDEQGACRIYPRRPLVCRTQGLPLRFTRPGPEPGSVEEVRDICPLNEPGDPPLLELPEDRCWLLGPFEGRLAALQEQATPGRPRRVRLRDLFGAPDPPRAPEEEPAGEDGAAGGGRRLW